MERSVPPTEAVDLDVLLESMTLEEKVALLSGKSAWVTTPLPRLGIPAVKVTDGPNGARGNGASGARAASFPVGAALGSTWNVTLIASVGAALGEEAVTKNAQLLLGPTVNLHRTPLGGRNFECYSEDPVLTGRLATAFIRGVQSRGVGACIKHFVCNDSEYQRHSISSDVDERTLRELYLLPFELAVRDAAPWAVMSAYNRVNGVFASSHRLLLRTVLKEEWGFDGIVVSDWGAALETEANLRGGLDLEMPGPTRTRGDALVRAVREGRVAEADVDEAAARMLRFIARSGRFERPDPEPERSVDRPEHRDLARRAAAEGMVLLSNDGLLPLDPERLATLAVIGPNARQGQIQGGGSSAVFPHYQVGPLAGLERGGPWRVTYAPGCFNHKYLPLPEPGRLMADGQPGAALALFEAGNPEPVIRRRVNFEFNPTGGLPLAMMGAGRLSGSFSAELEAELHPAVTGTHQFGLLSAGLSRLYVDGELLVDNWREQQPGDAFFGSGSTERRREMHLEAHRVYRLRIEYRSVPNLNMAGLRLGILEPHPADLLEQAVETARGADAVVIVAGSDADWETEGNDRDDMSLPGDQDALIEAVIAANARTVVVLNTGAPVSMPWLERAAAVIQAWLPGQEFGHALADVITGAVNPSGRLPCTVPRRLEDTPAFTSYPGEHGHVLYGERMFMGYRWYDSRGIEPCLPFGHGLSYSRFAYSDLILEASGNGVRVAATVENCGSRAGQEVVQLYVAPRQALPQRPAQALRGFEKIALQAGQRRTVHFLLEPRDFAVWDPAAGVWAPQPGRYGIRLGASSRDIRLEAEWPFTAVSNLTGA